MLSIETANEDDLVQTADLHKRNLRLGLFPRLGRHFLRHYQESFLRSPYGIALVTRDEDDRISGALFGTTANAEHYRWVVRNCGWELAMAGGAALVTRPAVAIDFAGSRAGRYLRGIGRRLIPRSAVRGPQASSAPLPVLSHIVTRQDTRRSGIGRRLVERFRRLAGAEGADRAVLVTEAGGLGAPFFERIGCICEAERRDEDGHVLRQYRLTLDPIETHAPYDPSPRTHAGLLVDHDAARQRAGLVGAHPG
ncbi:GNAT family N-acetyltransferase [Arsenicitalea aurantiaca]|uniref:GNAT family N-acetyltransferase n=1 Tax=Arsenicitalea aurantiaca TaxID=1783274 RepID=A0A433X8N9_9HYPH|nr:GNAT family N-acetyltransferase [Arsenicitalea aurantiaca]RUT30398.1 GNAT family N-acetyltransferase [Arsenicitalea aurantiaca]